VMNRACRNSVQASLANICMPVLHSKVYQPVAVSGGGSGRLSCHMGGMWCKSSVINHELQCMEQNSHVAKRGGSEACAG